MDITKLTPDEKAQLMRELAQEEKAKKEKRENDIRTFKGMIDTLVNEKAPLLADFGKKQNNLVNQIFNDFYTVIELKNELYGVKDGQSSHTFSSRDGNGSIIIGYNEITAFDATVDVGLKKIHEFLGSLGEDSDKRLKIEKVVGTLTRKNKKGELNPTKVVALSELKADMNDELFSDGVDVVVNSQFKTRTGSYVRGWWREVGENGKETKLSFSISTNEP
jgi:hypothetical protein